MFSLPRDTVDVPVPPATARGRLGRASTAGRSTAWFAATATGRTSCPASDADARLQRAQGDPRQPLRARHPVLRRGQLRRLPEVVDALGGVTDQRPDPGRGRPLTRPTGGRHADLHPGGHPAHERRRGARLRPLAPQLDGLRPGQRQQRVLLSLASRSNPAALIPNLPELVAALKRVGPDRHPVDQLAELLGLADEVDTKNIRSFVFTPPLYQQEFLARPARLHHHARTSTRSGRRSSDAFTRRPGRRGPRQTLGRGGRRRLGPQRIGRPGRGARLAGYLEYYGLAASAPTPERRRARPAEHEDRRLQRRRDATARDDRRPREAVRGHGRPWRRTRPIRTDIVVTIGPDDPDAGGAGRPDVDGLAAGGAAAGALRRPLGATVDRASASARYSGSAPADRVEVALADAPARSARSRPSRPAGGRPR